MKGNPSSRTYRALVRLYPKAFRDEFGDDMTLLFEEQLRDEPTWRCRGRAVLDVVLTVPAQHVEVHMPRTRTPALVLLVSFVVAAIAFALVEGLVGLAVAALGAVLAGLIWRRERPDPADRAAAQRWWKLLASGAVLLAAVISVTTVTGELSEPAWVIAALSFLGSVFLIGAGVVLGLVHARE